jgi:PAS domain S-box-containing protein
MVPATVMVLGLVSGLAYFYLELGIAERRVEASIAASARYLGGTLATMCPYLIEQKLPDGAQRAVEVSANEPDLRAAYAFDAGLKVLFSTRENLRGQSAKDTSAEPYLSQILQVRKRQGDQIEIAPDGGTVTGAFPFELKPDAAQSYKPGTGVIFLEYDLVAPKKAARANELRHTATWGGLLFLLCAALVFLFGRLLTARVRRLVDASAELAAGRLDVRAGLRGSDELAWLSDAFDRMAGQFQARESELRESEARFRLLVENIPQVFWLTQVLPERVLYVAPSFERIWGCKAEELYRNPRIWVDLIHPDERERVGHLFEAWLTGRTPTYEATYRIVRPDGGTRWIRDRGTFLAVPRSDQPRRIAGFAEDITEEKRAADEREAIERKLQDAQRLESLGVLAGGIAHDFNNLLTGMLGNASLARMMIAQSDDAQTCLAEIEATAQRAAELCKQMLAYSGKGRFVAQALDVKVLLEESRKLLEVSIDKNAGLRFSLDREIPQILADPTQMRQVVMNLIINASEALGGKDGSIKVSTGIAHLDGDSLGRMTPHSEAEPGDYVRLEVADNGCGIDSATLERVFDPFFTTKFTGRGLGLSAVLGIVRSHKGALNVDSQPGKGTTFQLYFPVAKGRREAGGKDGLSAKGWRGTGTILIVDDEETVRAVAARMLAAFGFKALLACDGREGVERFQAAREEIVAVLLDMTMPHMDGEETFRLIREIDASAKVILMSGFSEQEALNRFSEKGLAGFLQKPFTPDALAAKLECIASPQPAGATG